MKKLLLIGSSGFIGSYFINKYKEKYEIKTFSFLKEDINALDCSNLDFIFYLSALVHQMGGASASDYEKINVTQTIELAKKAKESRVKHFVFMSTVKIYGEETNSKYTENTVCNPEDNYGKSKLFKIISEKEKNQLKEKLGINLGSLVIGNVNRFTKDKGIDVIIKVIQELQDKYNLDIIFLHVGRIEDIDYYNNIKIKNMISLGFKKQEDLYLYYNLMDLFVFPSLREGFGLSVAEANLCGVPALVSNIKGLNEVVETGKNGFKIDSFNQYIEYINYYYLNKEELNNLKENTLSYAQKRFNQIDSALNTYYIYQNLLKKKA